MGHACVDGNEHRLRAILFDAQIFLPNTARARALTSVPRPRAASWSVVACLSHGQGLAAAGTATHALERVTQHRWWYHQTDECTRGCYCGTQIGRKRRGGDIFLDGLLGAARI